MATHDIPTRAETPIAFIQAMVQAYRRRGLDPTGALAKAQIAPFLLQQPHACVTALQMEWMSEAAMRELDDEALGWFRRRLPWGSYGMLVRASVTAPTLGVAMKRWCRHHNLLTDDITLRVSTSDGLAHIDLLEHPEHHDLGELREFCIVSVLTVRPYRRDRLLVEKVRQVLAEHLAQARNADDVAAHLGLSTRTLHRQLKEEGASLQQLKDSVRRERALALLHKTRKPIKQVAAAVGFANDKSFMRAFRLWTGKTVEDVRGA